MRTYQMEELVTAGTSPGIVTSHLRTIALGDATRNPAQVHAEKQSSHPKADHPFPNLSQLETSLNF